MTKPTINTLLLAFFMFLIDIVIGSAITLKLTNWNKAINYFWFTLIISIFAFSLQLKKYNDARKNLSDQLSYLGFFGFCMVWFMLSLFMPIFWMDNIDLAVKIMVGLFSVVVITSNFLLGYNEIKRKWLATGRIIFEQEYKKFGAATDWEKVSIKMNITAVIHIPGIPKRFIDIASILLIVFMVIGLNLRTAMPTFSVFAWGIPSTVFAGCFAQMIGAYFSQRSIVKVLELENSVKFHSTGKNNI